MTAVTLESGGDLRHLWPSPWVYYHRLNYRNIPIDGPPKIERKFGENKEWAKTFNVQTKKVEEEKILFLDHVFLPNLLSRRGAAKQE